MDFPGSSDTKDAQLIPFQQRVPGLRDGHARERGTTGFQLLLHAPRLSSKLSESSTLRPGSGTANTTSLATWSTRIRERSSMNGVRKGIRRTGNEADADAPDVFQGVAIGESAKQRDQGRFTKHNAPTPVHAR